MSSLSAVSVIDQGSEFAKPGYPAASDVGHLPSAYAPLIRNAWYVVAESAKADRTLRSIKVLGVPLVFYRTEAGAAVVLDDRCAHRRYPLSCGKLLNDQIECGYHGFTYAASGACVWAPTLKVKPGFGVRAYATAEVGPWLWAWMGDPDAADPASIPYPKLADTESWRQIEGYALNPGNYMLLIENLLDLSHLHFLHGPEVSTRDQADNAPASAPDLPPNSVGWNKVTDNVTSGLFAGLAGGNPGQIVSVHSFEGQIGPSMNYASEVRFAAVGGEAGLYPLRFHVAHAITPQDLHTTHQFYQFSVNVDFLAGLEQFRAFADNVVFRQDIEAIEAVNRAVLADDRCGTQEFGVPGDRFGVKMRRILREMYQAETALE